MTKPRSLERGFYLYRFSAGLVSGGNSILFCKTLSEAELRGLGGRCVRARHLGNRVAPGVVLTGKGKGGQPLAHTETYTVFVPYCVSTVLGKTLSEAELRGLEGLDLFFFFDKFWL